MFRHSRGFSFIILLCFFEFQGSHDFLKADFGLGAFSWFFSEIQGLDLVLRDGCQKVRSLSTLYYSTQDSYYCAFYFYLDLKENHGQ